MIRPAKFADTPAIERLLRSTQEKSKYAGRCAVNDKALNDLVMAMIAGQNQRGPQATYVTVCEHDGEVVGFMSGVLNRVYNIGDKLVASDVFLVNEGSSMADTLKMIDGYIDWAKANPKVIEIGLSWSDAVGGGQTLAKLYKRKGFEVVGEQFEMRMDVPQARAA
jgi:hypothetical protein